MGVRGAIVAPWATWFLFTPPPLAYKVWGVGILFSGCPWFHDSNFVSAPYLENKVMEFDQILHMHWYWQYLDWIFMRQFSSNSNRVMALDDPWFLSEFCFRSISWERIDEIWPNCAYALVLTRSRLGLLHVHQSYGPWWSMMMIFVRILFPLNILSTKWWNFTEFCICIDIDKIRLGLLHVSFHQIVLELWPLMSHDFCQNFVSA